MDFTQLSSADLRQIQKLIARRERLANVIAKIDQTLSGFGGEGKPVTQARAKRKTKKKNLTPSGELKSRVIALLKGAGKNGLAVKEIAQKIGTKYNNISSWFQSTGKKIEPIKKAGPARYVWRE